MSPLLPRFRGLLYPAQVLLRGRQWAGMPSLQPHAVRTPSFFCSLGLGARITALFFFFFFQHIILPVCLWHSTIRSTQSTKVYSSIL